ncbi:hypothetical protein QIH87_47305 [Bradyrhizobium elkanii]|uniref:hypothetical protein n=1 Tax=Bradyrhizobium elkanii TaxID=29448 RepID=UPI0027151306|nr:hypothetical protein [Bradyrhizobium elkanii]WLB09463.1 hypothetical protein QIH87_47305 [Bradyrhizobium elkanii]WLB72591.1 hypothetical protein QIH89_01025 [Bradyrhizobium elkanii]
MDFAARAVVIIIAIGVAVTFLERNPGIFLAIVVAAIGIFLFSFLSNKAKADRARQAEEAAHQRALQGQILKACNDSLAAFENIPKDLLTAEELLDVADNEFREGAFSPFWDSIEGAIRKLGTIDSRIELIADRSNRYMALTKSYRGTPPSFPVDPYSARRLGAATDTAARLQRVVRQAQRDFQFASIYEQRKTRELLMAGFDSLGEAIHCVGARLERSINTLGDQIEDLSSSMIVMNEKVVDAVKGVSSAVSETSSQIGEVSLAIKGADTNTQTAMADQAARQDKANRMLDNIQRHRVPPPLSDS